jgi:NAD(P)H-flavin reductase
MQLIIRHVRQQGREIRSFDFAPAPAENGARLPAFIPGQVAVLQFGEHKPAYFAFASAPEDDQLEFLIKRNAGAAGELYEMNIGGHVTLTDVVGHGFPLADHAGRDLILIAMGTGVAPLRSALRSALSRAHDFGKMFVLYGARTPDDFCYREEIEDWRAAGVELRQVISQPTGYDWSGPTGYVQSLLDNVLPGLATPLALVCGSRDMIEQTRDRLGRMGLAPEQILTNY